MGVSKFVTDNVGNTYDAPQILINNYDKIGKLYDKSNNIRNDFLQKLSTSIINENLSLVVEDLNVKKMF